MIVCASLCMAGLDTLSKHLVLKYPVGFVVWTRYCLQTLMVMAIFGGRMGFRLARTRAFRMQVLRGALMVTSTVAMVMAFRSMPLAAATAIVFVTPAFVTVLAILLLNETITVPRVAAVGAGMLGVLLIVRPGSAVFQPAATFPLVAALAVAIYQVLTRKLAGEDARTSIFYASAVGAAVLSCAAPWRGATVETGWLDVGELAAVAALATLGHFLLIRALQRAPASGLAGIGYVQLIFATALGFFVFAEFPDQVTLCGMFVIMASGFSLTWYERARSKVPLVEPPAID